MQEPIKIKHWWNLYRCPPLHTIIQATTVASTRSDIPKVFSTEIPSPEYDEWALHDMEVYTYLIL